MPCSMHTSHRVSWGGKGRVHINLHQVFQLATQGLPGCESVYAGCMLNFVVLEALVCLVTHLNLSVSDEGQRGTELLRVRVVRAALWG